MGLRRRLQSACGANDIYETAGGILASHQIFSLDALATRQFLYSDGNASGGQGNPRLGNLVPVHEFQDVLGRNQTFAGKLLLC